MERRESLTTPMDTSIQNSQPGINRANRLSRLSMEIDGSTSSSQLSPEDKSNPNEVKLKKSISLMSCSAILMAVTGHVSIFIAPSAILTTSGSVGASLVIWLVGGIINLTQALCFAEMGTIFPKAGGPYAYVLETLGPLNGFLVLWGYCILIIGPFWAFCGQTAALFILSPAFPDCHPPDAGVKLLGGWIIVTMVVLNCAYMKYVTKAQSFLTSTKIFALMIILIGGMIPLAKGQTENFEEPFETTNHGAGQIAVSILYSIFSYGGWQVMSSLMEEMKNPSRDLPIALYMTFAIVIVKYILTNIAYYVLLSPAEIAKSESVALDFIQRLYPPIGPLIAIFVALSSIGALNVSIMGHSRVLFAGARLGQAPKVMGMLHDKFMVPWPAIFTLGIWSLIMLYAGGLLTFMEYIGLYSTYIGLCVTVGLLYYRWKAPHVHRPYKINLGIAVIQALFNGALLILGVYQKPEKNGTAFLIVIAGIPVYYLGVRWKNKPAIITESIEKITIICQKLFSIRSESS